MTSQTKEQVFQLSGIIEVFSIPDFPLQWFNSGLFYDVAKKYNYVIRV